MNRIPAAFITLLLLTLLLNGCGNKTGPESREVKRTLIDGVELSEAKVVRIPETYDTTGTVHARDTAVISSKVMGEVKEVLVRPGDRIKKGDILLRINSPDIDAKAEAARQAGEEALQALKMAEEKMRLMDKTFSRFRVLHKEKALSEQEFDEIKTKKNVAHLQYQRARRALKRAEAAGEAARAYRGYTILRSPLDGTVAEKRIDTGSMASPGMPLLIIEGNRYWIEAPFNEMLLEKVKPGAKAKIAIGSLALMSSGRVSEIVHRIDPASRTFLVRIVPEEIVKGLRGGLYARVFFPVGQRETLLVPQSAIVRKGQLRSVFVAEPGGILRLRIIKTGKRYGSGVEVLSGLNPGESVVVRGVDKAFDGGRIKGYKNQ